MLRVSLFASRPGEPDWPMVFKGFSEALSPDQLAQLANDTALGMSREEFMLLQSKIETPKLSCMEQVDGRSHDSFCSVLAVPPGSTG